MQRYKQSGKIWQDGGWKHELSEEISGGKRKLSQEKGHAEVAKNKIRQLLKAFLTGVKSKQNENWQSLKGSKKSNIYIIVVPPEKSQNIKTEIKVIIKNSRKLRRNKNG